MSDLISRQAAIDAISSMLAPTPTQKDMVEDCLEIIENLSSAEPKTGKWIRVDEKPYFRKHFHKVCCSNCNEEGYKKWNYCPNCGTKMGKVSEHE